MSGLQSLAKLVAKTGSRSRRQEQAFEHRFLAATLAALVLVLGLPLGARAATFTVLNLNNAGPGSLRQAILDANAAPGADTITFAPSLSGTIILTTGQLTVRDDVTITGPGAAQLAVSGNDSSRVFRIAPVATVTISGLTVTKGLSRDEDGGGGILNLGALTIDRCAIRGNRASSPTASSIGGGISNIGSLSVSLSTINGNSADGGGGMWNTGPLVLMSSRIIGNGTADDSGGGIFNLRADLTVIDSIIRDNVAVDSGGGIFNNGGPLTVRATVISNNIASFLEGGGIYNSGSASITGSTISGNIGTGGGIFNVRFGSPFPSAGALRISSTTIDGNSFSGIHNDSGVVDLLANSKVVNNTGPGIVNAVANQLAPATLRVRSSTVSANTHEGNGGGIFNEATETVAGTVSLVSATVNANTAESGGGVYNQGILALTSGSTITMNTATGGLGSGGGVFIDGGSVTLDASSSVTGNTPDDFAGG